MLEMGLAVIVACLPALQSLVRKTWPIELIQSIQNFLSRHSLGSSKARVFQHLEGDCASSQVEFNRTQVSHLRIFEETIGMEDLDRR